MTTHQPPSQPGYAAALAETSAILSEAFHRVHDLMNTRAPGSDEWNDCYHVQTAMHLACQLADDARDRERARNAPVPFLPVEPAAQAHLRAILDDVLGALPDAAGALPVVDIEAAAGQLAAAIQGRLTADEAIDAIEVSARLARGEGWDRPLPEGWDGQ